MTCSTRLQPGAELRNGGLVLDHDPQANVLLALYHGEYVTWVFVDGEAFWGHYHQDNLAAAIADFESRCAQKA